MDPVQSFSDGIRFVQRVLAENNEFCARGAPKFRKICNSFIKFLRGFRVISTPDAQFFASKQRSDFTESFSDVTRFAQRALADCTQYCLRAACRNSENFAFFANFLRKSRVISMPDAHFFGCEQTSKFRKSGSDVVKISATNAARIHAIFLRKARRNSGNFAILSRNFGIKVA